LGKLDVVLLNVLGTVQTITVKNPSTDQHRGALVPLGESLGLRQTTHAQRCGHDRIRLIGKSFEKPLHSVKFIRFIEPLINFTN